MSVVVWIDLRGKDPYRQVGVDVVWIREPTLYNGSTLAHNIRDVGSSPTLCTLFPIVVTSTTPVWKELEIFEIDYLHKSFRVYR